jgi:hypothetical protein
LSNTGISSFSSTINSIVSDLTSFDDITTEYFPSSSAVTSTITSSPTIALTAALIASLLSNVSFSISTLLPDSFKAVTAAFTFF